MKNFETFKILIEEIDYLKKQYSKKQYTLTRLNAQDNPEHAQIYFASEIEYLEDVLNNIEEMIKEKELKIKNKEY